MRRWLVIWASMMFLCACGTQETDSSPLVGEQESKHRVNDQKQLTETGEPLLIYTTVFVLEDFIKKIGGDHVEVKNLIPIGVDAHTYEPSVREMIAVAESDGFFYSGGGMEGFIESMMHSLRDEKVPMFEASEGVEFIGGGHDHHHHGEEDHHHDHHHGDRDPHVWIDPIRAIQLARNVKAGLQQLKPEASEAFEKNFEQLVEQLEALDQSFLDMTESAERRMFLVAHAGYTYWEERYGLEQVAITGFSPMNEPSLQQVKELIEFAEEHDLSHIGFERNYKIPIAEKLMEELGGEAVYFNNLENVVQTERDKGFDYFDLMEQNVKTLERLLNE
ncbi:metal ABC transporter substrate-binding protein [Halalkalibacterium halodurans]|uniref:metal ABC transporter substrate-binding protein n=1 Tax=Halalkalibacterium halodurans TaxID=86665 RepID=UPI002E1E1A70|nr:metal ABC transporter substrate-binding protein [Halalkalibacterium halodurans]